MIRLAAAGSGLRIRAYAPGPLHQRMPRQGGAAMRKCGPVFQWTRAAARIIEGIRT